MIKVIAGENPDEAEKLMKAHVRTGLKHVMESLRKSEIERNGSLSLTPETSRGFIFAEDLAAEL